MTTGGPDSGGGGGDHGAVHYLDNAATTPIRPSVLAVMTDILSTTYGNPSGAHRLARAANLVVDESREAMAAALGTEPGRIVFTSGGTEADNLAVTGAVEATGRRPVCSVIEHHAVLDPVLHHGGHTVAVGADGRVDLDHLSKVLTDNGPDIAVVSVMTANNETGVIQPLNEVAALVGELAPDALLHTDAVQALCWLDVAAFTAGYDMVSVSAHKFGGPKGTGALVVRERAAGLIPILKGGGQERGRRGGTHNVAGIAGMAVAATETVAERAVRVPEVAARRDRLADAIMASIEGVTETGVTGEVGATGRVNKTANICHLCFDGVASEALLFLLERKGIMASAASSCSSGAMEPSHVLAAMGYDRDLAFGSLRLSLGYNTTDDDIEAAVDAIAPAVAQLRQREHQAVGS